MLYTQCCIIHYWYNIRCKAFGFKWNKKNGRHCCLNNYKIQCQNRHEQCCICWVCKQSTILSMDSKWTQCDYCITKNYMICKYIVKKFQDVSPWC